MRHACARNERASKLPGRRLADRGSPRLRLGPFKARSGAAGLEHRPGLAVHRPVTVARGARLPSLRSAPAQPAVLHRVLGLRPTVNGETLQTAQAQGPNTRLHATKDGPGSTQPPAQFSRSPPERGPGLSKLPKTPSD